MSDKDTGPLDLKEFLVPAPLPPIPPMPGPSTSPAPPASPASLILPPKPPAQQARIETAVRDVFERKYMRVTMPYGQARELVWLERDIVLELTTRLA